MIFAVDLQIGVGEKCRSLGSGHFYEDPQPDLGGAPRDPRGTPLSRKHAWSVGVWHGMICCDMLCVYRYIHIYIHMCICEMWAIDWFSKLEFHSQYPPNSIPDDPDALVHIFWCQAMKCFWSIDESASDLSLPDLCPCSMDVVEDRVLQQGNHGEPQKWLRNTKWSGSFETASGLEMGDVPMCPHGVLVVEHVARSEMSLRVGLSMSLPKWARDTGEPSWFQEQHRSMLFAFHPWYCEEKSGNSDDDDFDYPRERFNEWVCFSGSDDSLRISSLKKHACTAFDGGQLGQRG